MSDRQADQSQLNQRRVSAKAESNPVYQLRRKQVIAAAAKLFRDQGVNETTLDDVASAAGIDRSSIYYYVQNKTELFFEIVTNAMEAIAAAVEELDKKADKPDQKLFEIVRSMMESYAANYPSLFVYIQEQATGRRKTTSRDKHLSELNRRIDALMVETIKQGMDEGVFDAKVSPRLAANAIFGMVNWSHRWYRPERKLDVAQLSADIAYLAVRSLSLSAATARS